LGLSYDEHIQMGAAARQRIIQQFSLDANIEAFLKLYLA
jgi:glycosyltransferase involved in cell wall biosynthesis